MDQLIRITLIITSLEQSNLPPESAAQTKK